MDDKLSLTMKMHPVFGSAIKRAVMDGKSNLIMIDGRKIDHVDHADKLDVSDHRVASI